MMSKKIPYNIILVLGLVLVANSASVTVNKLEGVSAHNLVYSGFLPISDSSSDQLFFTYYGVNDKSENDLKNYPLLVVLGSPGSSAQFISMAGMGPILLRPDMTVQPNSQSPTAFANVMFVDLLGNGFSFVSNIQSFPSSSQDYGTQLNYALNAFAKQSFLGQSPVVVLVGEGTFIRSLPGLDDIDRLSGIVHISSWPEMYAISRYYGVAGLELKLFTSSQRYAVESTMVTCYNNINSKKYLQAHRCYDSVLNYVSSRTNNTNLYDVQLKSNLTDHMATIQYYFSQSAVVSTFKAPTSKMFDTQSFLVWKRTYTDLSINKTAKLSSFMKDYLTYKHWFVSGSNDFISYRNSIKFWLQNELSFVQSTAFRAAKLEDIVLGGQTVGYGKQVKQVKYTELLNAGHYVSHDQPKVFGTLLNDWLKGISEERTSHITLELSEQ